jgi:type I restriction-modification system DNA methylase subunit
MIQGSNLQTLFERVFNEEYSTSFNKHPYNVFGKKRPDGAYINGENIIIVENKAENNINKALKQALSYVTPKIRSNFNNIYLLLGFGVNKTAFTYHIYDTDGDELDVDLEGLKDYICPNTKARFDKNKIHDFNQYLYDNSINLPKSQKTLFIASMLICLKLEPNFINIAKYCITTRMIELIQNAFNDSVFTEQFRFITQSLFKAHLPILFQKLVEITSNSRSEDKLNIETIDEEIINAVELTKTCKSDVLNQFYSEFCLWDRNNDSKFGVVLTPDDVVEIMVNELAINSKDNVCDFCTGTGSFLIKSGLYTKNLYGAENNAERYALVKCNFILHDLDPTNLHYSSCFDVSFPKMDKVIINPPFSVKCTDGKVPGLYKQFSKEQKFIMYMIDCLKDDGIGACIIPVGNVNNAKSISFKNEFLKYATPLKTILCSPKLFRPNAGVKCVIVIFKKKPYDNEEMEIISYENDGYKIKKNQRIKVSEPSLKLYRQLAVDNEWIYMEKSNPLNNLSMLSQIRQLETIFNELKAKIIKGENINGFVINGIMSLDITELSREYKIFSLFELVKHRITPIDSAEGEFPLVSSSMKSNGVVKHIDSYDLEGEYLVVSYAREPNTGFTSYHKGKFSVTSCVGVLKPIKNLESDALNLIALLMTSQLSTRHDRGNPLNNEILMSESIIMDENVKIRCKLSDIFKLATPKKGYKKYVVDEIEVGSERYKIPYYSAIKHNNGIRGYCEESAFDEGEYYIICKTGDGAGGYTYIANAPFNFNPTVMVLTSKIDIKNKIAFALYLTSYLHKIYDHGRSFTVSALDEEIMIPLWASSQ